jgi:hypothetical protein
MDDCDRYNVTPHLCGEYQDLLRSLLPEAAPALRHIRTLHKVLSLSQAQVDSQARIMFLDCDTVFFGDVAALFDRYSSFHFYAREESADEQRLRINALIEGLQFVPAYNTGIFLLNHGIAAALAQWSVQYVTYAWRLGIGMLRRKTNAPAVFTSAVADSLRRLPVRPSGIRFPWWNWWILDEIALSLLLGKLPHVTHGRFLRTDVLHGADLTAGRVNPRMAIALHYFTCYERRIREYMRNRSATTSTGN